MSVEQEIAKESVSGAVCGWAGCASASGGGCGVMDFEICFSAVGAEDWVSGRVFAARCLNLACPATGFATCLSLSDGLSQATWPSGRLGVFSAESWISCQIHVCVRPTVSHRASSGRRILCVAGMVALSCGFAVVMDWMSGLHRGPALWRCYVVTQWVMRASAFWEFRR